MKTRPIVLCDVDEVIAGMHTEFLRRYNRRWDDYLVHKDITSWEVSKIVKPECGEKALDIFAEPDLYDNVLPIDGALEGIKELRYHDCRVVFVSSCPVGSADAKVAWLLNHGFVPRTRTLPDVILGTDKSLIAGDVLIDDALHNVIAFNPRPTILFDQPHNQDVKWPNRARNWREVVCMALNIIYPLNLK